LAAWYLCFWSVMAVSPVERADYTNTARLVDQD
jgi:hypothetical protein